MYCTLGCNYVSNLISQIDIQQDFFTFYLSLFIGQVFFKLWKLSIHIAAKKQLSWKFYSCKKLKNCPLILNPLKGVTVLEVKSREWTLYQNTKTWKLNYSFSFILITFVHNLWAIYQRIGSQHKNSAFFIWILNFGFIQNVGHVSTICKLWKQKHRDSWKRENRLYIWNEKFDPKRTKLLYYCAQNLSNTRQKIRKSFSYSL